MRLSALIAAAVLGTASVAGCGSDGPGSQTAPVDLPRGGEVVKLDPADFTTKIDNPYFPLDPGTRMTYRESDAEDTVQSVYLTVTEETRKLANGIEARVVRDTVVEDGEIVEDTVDWYAQDGDGNVWYMGEETAEFKNGRLDSRAGSWEAGSDGAQPGVIMPADPVDGMTYRQEHYAGEAEDNGEILSTEEQVQSPYGHFPDAVMTKDTNALEPEISEYKLYARGVGVVMALGVSGGPASREELLEVDRAGADWLRRAGTAPLGRPPLP